MRYPLVKQEGLKNCGPCTLASIIEYYGGYVSVDALEDLMHTTKNGTSAYNLIEAARKIGFESNGIKVDKLDSLEYPCIAHVTISNIYNHFVVIYKVDDKVLIGDPASKVKYMEKDEFYNIWNNVIITLKPIRKLPYNKPKSLFSYIKNTIFKHKYTFIYLIIISIISAFISLSYSLLIKYIIDDISMFKGIVIVFVLLFILKYLLIWHKNNVSINLNKKISSDLTKGINKSLISLPYVYYKNHRVGEVVSRFNDINAIIDFINTVILSITLIPILVTFLAFMYLESRVLFIYMLIILTIYILLNYISSLILNKNIKSLKVEDANYNSILIESLNAFETIKGINIEKYMIDKLNKKYGIFKSALCKTEKIYSIREILLDIILNMGSIFIIVIGLIYQHNNLLTLGSVISFYLLYNYIIEPITSIMSLLVLHKEASNASRRIQELDYPITSNEITDGSIEYKNVTYKSGLNYILKNVNLKIDKGEKVAIIGKSGSGKSTLVKLLKGYYESDGVYIGKNRIETKIDNVSYISQNECLFEDTLYNNLICDDDNKINEVVDMCLINKNLNMFIEENGFNLSGGEKARVVLARTLLKPFDILIIDEGLSEIDSNSERIILKNIFKKYKDKTIIFITHRLDNLDLFGHLIELEDGCIIKDTKYLN